MKKKIIGLIIVFVISLLLTSSVFSKPKELLESKKASLESYADKKLKPLLVYDKIKFDKYEDKGKIKIVYFKVDNQEIKMITSEYNFDYITK